MRKIEIKFISQFKEGIKNKQTRRRFIKKIMCMLIGITLIMLGVSFFVCSEIGCDSVNIFLDALTKKTNLTIGFWTFISGVVFIVTALILDKKSIGITTIIYVLICQPIIDGFNVLLPDCTNIFMSLSYVILGVVVASFGAVLCICANLGLSIYEAFCFSISNHFKVKYVYVRYGVDTFFIVAGYLLGGTVGLGTVIALLTFGLTIDIFKKLFEDKIKKLIR